MPGEQITIRMSSLFRDYVASVRPRGKPFRSRSMVLCLAGHRPVLSLGRNARRQGLKTTFALLCPRSPGLTPRSLHWLLNSGLLNKLPRQRLKTPRAAAFADILFKVRIYNRSLCEIALPWPQRWRW
jgi:hypothetical protein